MKNFKIFIILFACLFSITGCKKSNDDEHTHKFENGLCACGQLDPTHTHKFVKGRGKIDETNY